MVLTSLWKWSQAQSSWQCPVFSFKGLEWYFKYHVSAYLSTEFVLMMGTVGFMPWNKEEHLTCKYITYLVNLLSYFKVNVTYHSI